MSADRLYEQLQHKEQLNTLNNQTTKPVELKKIEIEGGEFSDNYYNSLLNPILSTSQAIPLKDLNSELIKLREHLQYSGLFKDISINVDLDENSLIKISKNDFFHEKGESIPIIAKIKLNQIPQFKFSSYSTSTDYDASTGFRYLDPNFLKNASSLLIDINLNYDPLNKTLNKKIWDLTILTPFKNSPSYRAIFNPIISSIDAKSWASHTQFSRGGFLGIQKNLSLDKNNFILTNGVSIINRTIGDISNSASDSIRADAGDDVKIGIISNLKYDSIEKIGSFPINGVKFDLTNEFSGFNNSIDSISQNKEDSELNKFNKSVLKFENYKSFLNNNFTTLFDFQIGSIHSLDSNKSIHINDRFHLGGNESLKGFHLNSVGLKNGNDYIGGSSFFKTGLTFFSKIPNISNKSPLRLYNYINIGDNFNYNNNLEFLQKLTQNSGDLIKNSAISTGLGLAYKSPNAVLDLSYNFPLSDRSQDNAKPGLSFSVALNFF
ncbi:Outer membrane protein assembly factor yaeT [Wickerhamomyces ciferrii]|uniref:Outer membrane protein assembly factor yaeT n=1 Tax=Wickerhamomyces ciferrii (strain ATCC 14091 / BCRC 22168 / CBS 111 / JCM 3599 / NBRC 0793 / NRRL Y-1031 F-60-10) TaxID=1206466 RepID=K0KJN0_WICCF|nr:Outer membrane protein assembly factor yaeT [Wickerhamomyces ciferrii]CCH41288.1 Outer membrane protein assembly factor yaeT [Wickerhamomyces ciferrii]